MKTCNYAVVRFLPYRETGEFVNVGVVLFCREARFFDFAFETQEPKRVTDFFPELDKTIFTNGRQGFLKELLRIKRLLNLEDRTLNDEARMDVFRELVRTRESIFRFGETATVLTEDPAAKLKDLFSRYVNLRFGKRREFQETQPQNALEQSIELTNH